MILAARRIFRVNPVKGNFGRRDFLTQYPLPIYGVVLRRVLAFVVPLAFVSFFPALYVLGKRDPFTSLGVIRFLSPLVAAGTLVVARLAWRAGVRHYRSTGT